jgi:hypothetical protein
LRSLLFTGSAVGLAPSLTPAVIFLGVALRPQGLRWLTPLVPRDSTWRLAMRSRRWACSWASLGPQLRPAPIAGGGGVESAVTVAFVAAASLFVTA